MSSPILVIGGGEAISPREHAALPDAELVIAADSGIDRAHEVGLNVDVALGDFDSVSAQGYLKAETAGVELIRHPEDKNETDLELALLHAASLEPDRIVVAGIGGGRLDHLMSSVLLLADGRFASIEVDALVGNERVSVIHRRRTLTGTIGSRVSLLPIGGSVRGVHATGFAYELDDETLQRHSPRGMSNAFVAPLAVVSLDVGVLLAFQELLS